MNLLSRLTIQSLCLRLHFMLFHLTYCYTINTASLCCMSSKTLWTLIKIYFKPRDAVLGNWHHCRQKNESSTSTRITLTLKVFSSCFYPRLISTGWWRPDDRSNTVSCNVGPLLWKNKIRKITAISDSDRSVLEEDLARKGVWNKWEYRMWGISWGDESLSLQGKGLLCCPDLKCSITLESGRLEGVRTWFLITQSWTKVVEWWLDLFFPQCWWSVLLPQNDVDRHFVT